MDRNVKRVKDNICREELLTYGVNTYFNFNLSQFLQEQGYDVPWFMEKLNQGYVRHEIILFALQNKKS